MAPIPDAGAGGDGAHGLERFGEQLLPLMDRANPMMIRNLRALQARRERAAPSVSVGSASQVNIAEAQINVSGLSSRKTRTWIAERSRSVPPECTRSLPK